MSENGTQPYLRYWGKAAPEGATPAAHLLVYHLLDVAAVGRVLLDRHPALGDRLAEILGLGTENTRKLCLWLLVHHDLGKFAAAFQRLRPGLAPGHIPDRYRYTRRHDTLGYLLWQERLEELLPTAAGAGPDLEDRLIPLLAASSGHHGRPPEAAAEWESGWFRPEDIAAAARASRDLGAVVAPGLDPVGLLEGVTQGNPAMASWAVAGLVVLCDWIGSNRTWFPYRDEAVPPETYWERFALPQAAEAVAGAGVLPEPPRPEISFDTLFPDLPEPTGLQRAAETIPLGDGPALFVVEDLTGSGKTEAALTLAARLLAAGRAAGLFVALPTTATADAMYRRVGGAYRRMFQPGTRPSLVLAHSRRDLSRQFRQSIGGERIEAEPDYAEDEAGAAATCAAWLADSRKKALLAQVGVGTIDQALLAVLGARHQSLRALGLLGKVLVVDEVHACDAYQNRLLAHLLRLHAAQGGSAILLSATLPLATRQELAAAFAEGAGFEPPPVLEEAYPLVARISADGVSAVPTQPPPWARRTLRFELVHDHEAALRWVAGRAEAGAAVCWVRNTVGDALEAYDALAARLGPERVTLFHARFLLGDRLGIEDDILGRFGKASTAAQRTGRVVVATQVIEQSLDLDFDEMLTDLAPIDLLIQRAGRLRRHRRDRAGNPVDGPDRRGAPTLRVLSPEPVDDPPEGWIRSFLPGTSFVYPHPGELWRTARLLETRPSVRLPEDSRDLVERVYGDPAEEPPASLQTTAGAVEGERRADASLAELNAANLELGYGCTSGSWTDAEDARTRLGEPTVTLRLALWDGERLRPLCNAGPNPWAMSEVSVRRSQVAEVPEPADCDLLRALTAAGGTPRGNRTHCIILPVVPVSEGVFEGEAVDGAHSPVTLLYRPDRGLEIRKEKTPPGRGTRAG